MQSKKVWKFAAAGVLVGAIAIGTAACSASTTTATTTQMVTVTPQSAQNLILSSDMVVGSGGTPAPAAPCVLQSAYKPGEEVVFRVRVYDPATGNQMDDKALSSVTVNLPNGQTLDAKYSGHPATNPLDHFWAVSWTIPANYPTGTVTYTVKATAADGRTGTFDNFNVAPSLLTVVQ